MPTIYKNGKRYGGTSDSAMNVNYDNTNSNLESTTVQEVIDEVDAKIENKEYKIYETLDSVDLNDYVEPIRAICMWCSNAPKNDECGSKGRLEVAVDYEGTVHQRYTMFALDNFKCVSGIYERYKCEHSNYNTNGGWSEWNKVSAPLTDSLEEVTKGFALDATQGKVLNDKITQLNSDLYKNVNLFTPKETVDDFNEAHIGVCCGYNNTLNNPFPNFWTTVITLNTDTNGQFKQQIAISWSATNILNSIAYRVMDGSVWQEWVYLATHSNLNSLKSGELHISSIIDDRGYASFTLPKATKYDIQYLNIVGVDNISDYQVIASTVTTGNLIIKTDNTGYYNCSCVLVVNVS